jgi:hypothetical protein
MQEGFVSSYLSALFIATRLGKRCGLLSSLGKTFANTCAFGFFPSSQMHWRYRTLAACVLEFTVC